jgi:hypothetical protein
MYYTDCGSGGGTTYTFTNGLTESGGTVKLGGTLTDATTTIDINGNILQVVDVGNSRFLMNPGTTSLYSPSEQSFLDLDDNTAKLTGKDSLVLSQTSGNIRMRNLNYTLSTTGKKIMLRDTATGLVQNIDPLLLAQEATNFGDTTNFKPVVINTTGTAGTIGKIYKATYWPGGGGGSGVTTMGAIGSSPNANGATISGSTLNLEPASASFGGVVTTGTQTIAGNKTFTGVSVFGSPTVPAGNVQVGGTIWVSGGAGSTYYGVHDGTNQLTLAPTAMTFAGIGSGSIGYASGVMNIQGNANYSTVFNDNSADVDFRLEGDGDANLIFADAGNDKVGIGTASPTTKLHVAGRFAATQGADVASAAGAITLSTNGHTFEITGTAAITLISNAGWVNGSEINLIFTSTATLTDGTANSGTDIGMELAGNANFTASADDVLTLVLCEIGGVQRWREKSRSVN